MSRRRSFLGHVGRVGLVAAFAVASSDAAAGAYAPPANDPLALELFKLAKERPSRFTDPSTKQVWGRAEIFVDAPMKHVRAAISDFGNWSVIIPRFKKSKVLATTPAGTEVFLQVPILKGAVTLWGVERFAQPVADGKGEKIVGKLVKGNVEDLQAVWRYRPVDEGHTLLTLEVFIDPKLAVPQGVLISHRELACSEGVLGIRDRAQEVARLAARKP